jgi:hypothetical protein
LAYPVCFLFFNQQFKLLLFGCSFFITVVIQIFTDTFYGNTAKGALFKEVFDIALFNLPWKTTLRKPDQAEIQAYSKKYRGGDLKNWYSQNLAASIDHYTAVAVLQHSNTSWDIALRKLYKQALIYFLIAYTCILGIILLVKQADALTIFLLLFSLLSFYTHFITIIRGHSGAIAKRQAISVQLDAMIRCKRTIETTELRDIQDEIYLTRKESAKVPDFFFRIYKDELNVQAEEYIREVNALYGISDPFDSLRSLRVGRGSSAFGG